MRQMPKRVEALKGHNCKLCNTLNYNIQVYSMQVATYNAHPFNRLYLGKCGK